MTNLWFLLIKIVLFPLVADRERRKEMEQNGKEKPFSDAVNL